MADGAYICHAWGDILTTTGTMAESLGTISPLRYRGYVYDEEYELYYLQSRYYDPKIGRFINADNLISSTGGAILGNNPFAYCFNNPANLTDPSGNWAILFPLVVKVIAKVIEKLSVIKYDVPLYNQGNTNLCWAYAQTMVEDSNVGIVRTLTEASERAKEIAIDYHGEENWNRGGRPQDLTSLRSVSLISLYINLRIHGPLYASYGYYENGERKNGHAVVVTGVDLLNRRVYTNNPWGIFGDQRYDEFLIAFVGTNDTNWQLDACYYFNWW